MEKKGRRRWGLTERQEADGANETGVFNELLHSREERSGRGVKIETEQVSDFRNARKQTGQYSGITCPFGEKLLGTLLLLLLLGFLP